MNRKIRLALSSILVLALLLWATPALAIPPLPHAFYGTVTINGASAPTGTVVSAKINGVNAGSYTTKAVGQYGNVTTRDYLAVSCDGANDGDTITFYVTNANGTAIGVTASFEVGGGPTPVNLSVTITVPPPPAAGGGGLPAPPPGTTNVRGIVSLAGVFLRPVPAFSEDGLCTLIIPAGTVGLTEELEPLTLITMLIMDDPPPPPEYAHIIGLPHEFQPSGATFDPPATLTCNYDPDNIPEGIAEGDLVLAYYDQKAGEWVNLEVTVDIETNTITALISHFTAFSKLGYEVPEPAAFTSGSLVILPTEVDIGQTVNVSLSVANTGGMAGSYGVMLKINDVAEAIKQVTVDAGTSTTVTFTTSRDVAGSYSVDVNGLSGSFTVKEEVAPAPPAPPPPAPPPEVKAPINWPVVGGSIAGVVIVGLLIFFLIRRRRAL